MKHTKVLFRYDSRNPYALGIRIYKENKDDSDDDEEEVLVNIPIRTRTYEELILLVLKELGYNVDSVDNELTGEDCSYYYE